MLLFKSGGEEISVPKNTEFRWGDSIALFTTEDATVSADSAIRVGRRTLGLIIPVSTIEPSDITLSAGSKLNWSDAPSQIIDIYVSSPVSGGSTYLDASTKASLISAKLSGLSFIGSEGLTALVVSRFMPSVVSAHIVKDAPGVGRPGSMMVSLKQSRPASVELITAEVSANSSGVGEVYLRVSNVTAVTKVCSKLTGESVPFTTEIDSEGVRISLGTSYPSTISVYVRHFEELGQASTWLNDESVGMPFKVDLVTPTEIAVALHLPIKSGSLDSDTITDLCKYVCGTKLNGSIDGGSLTSILSNHDIVLTKPIGISCYNCADPNVAIYNAVGGLSSYSLPVDDGRPVALYLTADNVKVV